MKPLQGSMTVIAVIHDSIPGIALIERLANTLERCTTDFELILVANGTGVVATLALKALAAAIPDLTAVLLAERVHDDLARLVGIEHATGDHLLFCNPLSDDLACLPALLTPLQDGYDLVVAERGDERPPRSPLQGGLVRMFGAAYSSMTGRAFDLQPTGLRVLSRAAALSVAGRPDAELRLRLRAIGPGFPAITVPVSPRPAPDKRVPERRKADRRGASQRHGHGWSKGVGLLLSASTMPLRGASYAALAGGALSVLYSLYVFAIYLLKPDVAAGWTTLSLQQSAMMLVFSVVLLFLSEYVIQIYAASPPRSRRHLVVRELRSTLSRRARRLNIVDAEGRFELGKPTWLVNEGLMDEET